MSSEEDELASDSYLPKVCVEHERYLPVSLLTPFERSKRKAQSPMLSDSESEGVSGLDYKVPKSLLYVWSPSRV